MRDLLFCRSGRTLLLIGLLFLSPQVLADASQFAELAETVDREAQNKGLPLLSIVLVDDDGIDRHYP